MAWDVEGTDEFAGWFENLKDEEQASVGRVVELLVEHVPIADMLYDGYLGELRPEGLI